MANRTSVLARVVALQRAFLLAVTLEDRRVQLQTVAFLAPRQSLHLPLRQGREKALPVAHRELFEEIADRVVGGPSIHSQQLAQGLVSAQPIDVRETPRPDQHSQQKSREGAGRIDLVGRTPTHRHVLAHRSRQIDPAPVAHRHGYAAERRHRALRLSEHHPLTTQQAGGFWKD